VRQVRLERVAEPAVGRHDRGPELAPILALLIFEPVPGRCGGGLRRGGETGRAGRGRQLNLAKEPRSPRLFRDRAKER
jgi:hypothetical protein